MPAVKQNVVTIRRLLVEIISSHHRSLSLLHVTRNGLAECWVCFCGAGVFESTLSSIHVLRRKTRFFFYNTNANTSWKDWSK